MINFYLATMTFICLELVVPKCLIIFERAYDWRLLALELVWQIEVIVICHLLLNWIWLRSILRKIQRSLGKLRISSALPTSTTKKVCPEQAFRSWQLLTQLPSSMDSKSPSWRHVSHVIIILSHVLAHLYYCPNFRFNHL